VPAATCSGSGWNGLALDTGYVLPGCPLWAAFSSLDRAMHFRQPQAAAPNCS
jgi:hypothetical protein